MHWSLWLLISIQLLRHFSGLCLTSSLTSAFLCLLHFQAVSSTTRDRDVPPQPTETPSLYAVDHLAASVEKECFFPISYSKKVPGLTLPGQIWPICSSLIRSLCTYALGWGGGLTLKNYMT